MRVHADLACLADPTGLPGKPGPGRAGRLRTPRRLPAPRAGSTGQEAAGLLAGGFRSQWKERSRSARRHRGSGQSPSGGSFWGNGGCRGTLSARLSDFLPRPGAPGAARSPLARGRPCCAGPPSSARPAFGVLVLPRRQQRRHPSPSATTARPAKVFTGGSGGAAAAGFQDGFGGLGGLVPRRPAALTRPPLSCTGMPARRSQTETGSGFGSETGGGGLWRRTAPKDARSGEKKWVGHSPARAAGRFPRQAEPRPCGRCHPVSRAPPFFSAQAGSPEGVSPPPQTRPLAVRSSSERLTAPGLSLPPEGDGQIQLSASEPRRAARKHQGSAPAGLSRRRRGRGRRCEEIVPTLPRQV